MKLRNKVLTTSLAASLVLGSVAGLPLSSKGLAEAIGAGTAYAANPIVDTGFTAELDKVYPQLTDEEKQAIRAARTELGTLTDETLVSDITDKTGTNTAVTNASILELVTGLSQVLYDQNYDSLLSYVNDPENRALFIELKNLSGVTDNITYADAVAFSNAFKQEAKARLSELDLEDLVLLANDLSSAKDEFEDVLQAVIDDSTLKISQVLQGLDLDAATLRKAYDKINNAADTANNDAQKALIAAFARAQSTVALSTVSGNWRQLAPSLSVRGRAVPTGLVNWTVSGNDNVTVVEGKFVLASTVSNTTKVSVDVTASDSLFGKLLYKGTIELTFTKSDNNSGGSGGGGGPAPTGDVTAPDTKKAEEALTKVAEKLTELLGEGKGEGLAKAREAIQEAIRKAATVDLSQAVKVEGNVAKPTLDVAKLEEVFKAVKEIAKLGNDKLKEAAPDAKPAKVVAILDLGALDAKTTQVPLSADLIAKAKENGIEALAIKVNGISLAVDLDQLSKDTNVTINKEEKTVATSITKLAVASEVYEFTFESEGKKIESFTKPVEVRIPLPSVSGVDSELLVLTKLDDGKLVFKGGKYNAETKEFVALNKSFSTYAVIENKVAFNDIASVNGWAGHEIAVTAAKGIVEGRSEGQFVPGDNVTRAEFAKLIVKAFGLEDASATEAFSDVNESDWFKPYVAAAVKAGLINGRSDDKFEPNAIITRAELATIASRALTKVRDYTGVANADAALKAFVDAGNIHSSLKDGVALAADQGIVVGEEGGKFNPNNGSTRAQAAVVIYRLLNK